MNLRRIVSRIAGFLIFAMLPVSGALAENVAAVAPPSESAPMIAAPAAAGTPENEPNAAESVRVAQANNEARYNDPRPITLGDYHRFQDDFNMRMDRIDTRLDRLDARIDHLSGRVDLILTVIVGGLLGIIAVLLARRERPREHARRHSIADQSPSAAH